MKKTIFIFSFLFLTTTALTGCYSSADNRNVNCECSSVSSPTSSPTGDTLVDNSSDLSDEESSSTPNPTIVSIDDNSVDNTSDFSETEASSKPTSTPSPSDDGSVDNASEFSKTEVSGTPTNTSIENSDKKFAILHKKLVQYDDEGKIIYKSQSLKYLGQKPELSYSDLGELFLVTYDKPQTNRGGMYIYVFDKKLSKIKLLLRGITVCSLADGNFYDSNRDKAWKYTKGKLNEVPFPKN